MLEIIPANTSINVVAETAATGHFLPNENNNKNKHKEIEGACANNENMVPVATTNIDVLELTNKEKTEYFFDEMKQPLMSIPLLADDGCKINLTKNNIVVTKNNKTILKGVRDKSSTLWMTPIKHHKIKVLLAQDLPPVEILHEANSVHYQLNIAKIHGIP